MPRKPPTDRISASIWLFLMAMSVISPTDSSFWLYTFRPFIFDENISSFETVENFASAGAVPTVLASCANAGLASMASEAVISAIFFILSSSAELILDNAGQQERFHQILRNNYDAARCVCSWSRN